MKFSSQIFQSLRELEITMEHFLAQSSISARKRSQNPRTSRKKPTSSQIRANMELATGRLDQGCAFGQKFSVFPTDARPETKILCVFRPKSEPTENCPKTRKLPESPNRVGSEPFFGPENPRFPSLEEAIYSFMKRILFLNAKIQHSLLLFIQLEGVLSDFHMKIWIQDFTN